MRTDYIINDCDVCLNPDILLEYKNREVSFQVSAMELADGMWSFGHNMEASTWGASGPVVPNSKWNIMPKEEGIRKKLNLFVRELNHYIEGMSGGELDEEGHRRPVTGRVRLLQQALEWANAQLGPRQLEFNF